jgi:hypothetical protein
MTFRRICQLTPRHRCQPGRLKCTLFGVRGASAKVYKKMQYQGLFGLIVLIADVWAIVNVFQSTADTGKKVLWTVLIILLPVLGFILWYFLGPKTGRA